MFVFTVGVFIGGVLVTVVGAVPDDSIIFCRDNISTLYHRHKNVCRRKIPRKFVIECFEILKSHLPLD